MNQAKTPLLTGLLLLLFYIPALAQTGRITGKVWNTETNAPVPGASVVLEGRQGGVSTDVDGQFFLTAERGKWYTLTVSGVGLVTRRLDSVTVNANATPLNVLVTTNQKSLQQVVVSTSIRRASVASLYSIQKNSSAISDGISADIIRRSPDKNTGDVLKRVSGASIQDNKFVIIRGINERYNVAMLNNAPLPSTEADKKAFAFNILPSSLVDNLTIYKAATPDLPGDFSGGAVKVQTKDFPSQPISELSVSLGINSKTTGKNFYKGQPNGKYDGLGYLDNSRLIPGPYYRQRGAEFINNTADYKREVTKMFPNTFGFQAARQSLPAISLQYTGGNTRLLSNGRKLGAIFSLGYGNGRAVSDRNRDEYDVNRTFQEGYTTANYEDKANLSALLSLAYSYGRSKIAWKTVYYNEFVKTLAQRKGYSEVNDPNFFYSRSVNNEVSQNGLVHSVVEGTHKPGNGWAIDWMGGVGYTYRNQPDQKILSFKSADNVDAGYSLSLSTENSPAIRTAGRIYSFLGEWIYDGGFSVSKTFKLGEQVQKWQFGSLNVYRDRSVNVSALGYAGLGDKGVTIAESKEISFGTLFTPDNIDRYDLTVANIANNSTDYTANALLNAGYMMLDNRFSEKLKATWGLRVERYRQKLNAQNKTPIDVENTDLLPSLLLTYALSNRTNLRLSGSRAVNRPEFRELASYAVYDYDNNLSVTGNPGLKRAQNTNADLRFEFFPQSGEILSASLFYKYFTDPIEQTNLGNNNLGYDNADNAYVYGAEIEVRKKLDFTGSDWLSHLTVYTNAAYIKGGVQFNGQNLKSPMQGQSPYLINAGLLYVPENESWSMNVLYNRIGPRLQFRGVRGGFNIFENPRNVLDVQVSKKLLKDKLELKLTLSDLLAQPFRWYYKYDPSTTHIGYDQAKDAIIRSFTFGTTATIGLRYNF
ncbi:TonB-dependent receptor [Puia sp.]|uniref:TonB-dependent receptor n=1 Tax=Puia sp. TaxID=2045100 RepID=UPI002F402E9F